MLSILQRRPDEFGHGGLRVPRREPRQVLCECPVGSKKIGQLRVDLSAPRIDAVTECKTGVARLAQQQTVASRHSVGTSIISEL
jgi:hypothetical protein